MPASMISPRIKRDFLGWTLVLFDIGFFLSLLIFFLAWLLRQFTVPLGIFGHLRVSWGVKPLIAMMVLAGLPMLFRRQPGYRRLWQGRWFQALVLLTGATVFSLIILEKVLS